MGNAESSLEDILLAEGLAGESLLHIGCGSGNLCRKALEQGASSATGLDISADRIRSAERDADARSSTRPEYIRADIEGWDALPKAFEVVACGNLLHHLYEPVAAVRKIMRLTRKRFYIHVAPDSRLLGPIGLLKAPRLTLGRRGVSLRATDCTFAFNRNSLEVIINRHSKAYEPVRFHRSHKKAGWIAEARRRRIGHLLVIAAATAAGKSTFIKRLSEPPVRERFGLGNDRFEVIKAEEIDKLQPGLHPLVVFHYDLLRPFDRPLQTHERDPAFQLLSCAERVTLITLADTAGVLRERMFERRRGRQARGLPLVERVNRKLEVIEDPAFLTEWYQAWFRAVEAFVRVTGGRAHFLRSDEHYTDLHDIGGVLSLFGTAAIEGAAGAAAVSSPALANGSESTGLIKGAFLPVGVHP